MPGFRFMPRGRIQVGWNFKIPTDTYDIKIRALSLHQSQVSDMPKLEKRIRDRAEAAGRLAGCRFAEAFVRLHLPE